MNYIQQEDAICICKLDEKISNFSLVSNLSDKWITCKGCMNESPQVPISKSIYLQTYSRLYSKIELLSMFTEIALSKNS